MSLLSKFRSFKSRADFASDSQDGLTFNRVRDTHINEFSLKPKKLQLNRQKASD